MQKLSSFVFILDAVKKSDDDELRLVKDLFNNYSKEVRPVKNKKAAIKVIFGIAYTQLVELVSTFKTVCVQVWSWSQVWSQVWKRSVVVAQFYRRLYGGRQVRAPHETNVSKLSRLEGTVSSLALDTFKRGKFTKVKASFPAVSTDFHQM